PLAPLHHGASFPVKAKQIALDELIDTFLRWEYLNDFVLSSHYPGKNLGAIAYQYQIGPQPNPQIKLMDWYYPTTAQRWSVFRGLATSTMVANMYSATAGGSSFATFTMEANPISPSNPTDNQTKFTISTRMRML